MYLLRLLIHKTLQRQLYLHLSVRRQIIHNRQAPPLKIHICKTILKETILLHREPRHFNRYVITNKLSFLMSDPLYLCLNFSGAASLIYYKSSSVSSLQCFQELEINLNFNKNRPLFRNPFFSRNFSIPLFMLQGACAAFRAPVYNKTARLVG